MEAKFITLVKSITSMSFTSKLEGMLNDESASRTLISVSGVLQTETNQRSGGCEFVCHCVPSVSHVLI